MGSTAYNEDSSRSHTICRIHIEVAEGGRTAGRVTTAMLSLIDLAGSESAKVGGQSGRRVEKEGE